jgi:hypothetical protein
MLTAIQSVAKRTGRSWRTCGKSRSCVHELQVRVFLTARVFRQPASQPASQNKANAHRNSVSREKNGKKTAADMFV